MESPIIKPLGTAVNELDTPSLIVDLDNLEHNIEVMHSFFRNREQNIRPRVDSHGCASIAYQQLAGGGTAGGISVQTLSQAETFAQQGFMDIFIANKIVTKSKITRLCSLASTIKITITIDNDRNITDLSEAAELAKVNLDVAVEINSEFGLFGVDPGTKAVSLARNITKSNGLCFAGLTSSCDLKPHSDMFPNNTYVQKYVQPILDTREMIEKNGIEVTLVSLGNTNIFQDVGSMDGVTEILAGSYALMDRQHISSNSPLKPSAEVICTITGIPDKSIAITDGGVKSIGGDHGDPLVTKLEGVQARSLSAEHGNLDISNITDSSLKLGDKVFLIPMNITECVNLHDYILGVRGNILETIWSISSRGHYN